ncbi:homing endonuclease [Jimgerdemannia flammicorona]|uniref:Homing endonuclease n=2 Tax=Jimgerdemannia flammicorona TaxID=994334 RepID=A0A432ZZT0_9FUNG|nr:homing endonuclease [Jimgerdemannia flammicorona]RUS21940.1 homing endonuclease [Jimgerdemannia flammicorona]
MAIKRGSVVSESSHESSIAEYAIAKYGVGAFIFAVSYFIIPFGSNLSSSVAPYCISCPKFRARALGIIGVPNYALELRTRSLPCFTAIYHLFYVNGVKVIPLDIFNLLSPIALAHMIMGDGGWTGSGLKLCTHSFSVPDCVRLMNVLMIRYRLDCTLQFDHGLPYLY